MNDGGSEKCLRWWLSYSFASKSGGYLSFTLRQGSIDSSFAATFATQPSVTLLRYIIGVLPINYINLSVRLVKMLREKKKKNPTYDHLHSRIRETK